MKATQRIRPKGVFNVEIRRADGSLKYIGQIENAVVNEGKNKLFDVMFGGVTAITGWVIGLIDNTSYSATPNTDTMSSHAGWQEFTGYSETTRVAWGPTAAANQTITNTTAATFTINATGTLRGIFLTSSNTKGGTTGTLWSTALFASTIAVQSGDQVKVTYSVSA